MVGSSFDTMVDSSSGTMVGSSSDTMVDSSSDTMVDSSFRHDGRFDVRCVRFEYKLFSG